MTTPLAGLRVVIGRPREQAARQLQLFAEAGAEVLALPLIDIQPPLDPLPLQHAAAQLATYDLLILVSPSAVDMAMPRLLQGRDWPATLQVALVGRGSAAALRRWLAVEPLLPQSGADSEALLQLPELQSLPGKRVLLLRGNGGRDLLADALRQRGAQVEIVEAYRRALPCVDLSPLYRQGLTALLLTSSEALANLLQVAGESRRQSLQSLVIFAIHPRIADYARNSGFGSVMLAEGGDAALLTAVCDWFAARKKA
ncbi:MAG: hypothetical protein RL210_1480 [Pseudomonadota bacterium]|jgi:uroporphyrinogen-III synthase